MEARLVVEVGAAPGSAHVVLPGQTVLLGRGPGVQIALADPALAVRHAAVRLRGELLQVVDMGGAAGTFLNERRLAPRSPADVRAGDALRLGAHLLRVDLVGQLPGRARGPERTLAFQAPVIPRDLYDVQGEIGRGAAGRVYGAVRRADGQRCAIKVLNEEYPAGSPDHQRFCREGRIGALVDSPYVVRVFDLQVVEGKALLVMELIEGPSARDLIAQGPVPVPEALRVAEDVAHALAAAAAAGVVHRDVKPANVLLAPEGVAKLGDFGIAKSLESSLQSLTTSGQGLGTLAYIAPEQIDDARRVDPRADLYGLGATLYHLLAGVPPFEPRTTADILAMAEAEPRPLAALRPDAPPAVAALVAQLMAKDPFDRPTHARGVAADLARLRERHHPGHPLDALFRGRR